MAVDLLLFVSKRASVAAAALLCLGAVHFGAALASGSGAPSTASAEVRVAVGR